MHNRRKPTEVTVHWVPESWGYYEEHWSVSAPYGHSCSDQCYRATIGVVVGPSPQYKPPRPSLRRERTENPFAR